MEVVFGVVVLFCVEVDLGGGRVVVLEVVEVHVIVELGWGLKLEQL